MLGELVTVYNRWPKGDKNGSEIGKEPACVEGVTEILISLLVLNNNLLRGLVGWVVNAQVMDNPLAVVKQKDGKYEEDGNEGETIALEDDRE